LGAPGFAFTVDSHGAVTGYAGFAASATTFTSRPCPATGTFTLHLAYERDVRIVTIPCQLGLSAATPAAFETPAAGFSATPFPVQTCPAMVACDLAPIVAAAAPSLPPASTPSPAPNPSAPPSLGSPSPPAAIPTACPAGFSGAAPGCAGEMIEQYQANADDGAYHTATLYANGSICDDDGCSLFGDVNGLWACGPPAFTTTSWLYGRNPPYQQDPGYLGAVDSMMGYAFHDASENDGDGIVYTNDYYCAGFPTPNQ
jgi:hypothetical protein